MACMISQITALQVVCLPRVQELVLKAAREAKAQAEEDRYTRSEDLADEPKNEDGSFMFEAMFDEDDVIKLAEDEMCELPTPMAEPLSDGVDRVPGKIIESA